MKTSTDAAEHYTWGAGCDGWHLVNQKTLSVIRERMPSGASEVEHAHVVARQFFFVLSGVLTIEMLGCQHQLASGEGLEVAPQTSHRVSNQGEGDVHFLVISQPHSHGDRV